MGPPTKLGVSNKGNTQIQVPGKVSKGEEQATLNKNQCVRVQWLPNKTRTVLERLKLVSQEHTNEHASESAKVS